VEKPARVFIFVILSFLLVINNAGALEKPTHFSLNGIIVDQSGWRK